MPKKKEPTPAQLETRFTSERQPAHNPGRPKKSVLYAGQIRDLENQLANKLPAVAAKVLSIIDGTFKYDAVNHKTGETVQLSPTPDHVIKAAQFITDRILGKPESVTKHDLGEAAAEIFQVLIGPASERARLESGKIQEAEIRVLPGPTKE